MGERIDRKSDEGLYQPAIHSDRIRSLYLLKELTGIPMTVLVDRAIADFVSRCETEQTLSDNSGETIGTESWEDLNEYKRTLTYEDMIDNIVSLKDNDQGGNNNQSV